MPKSLPNELPQPKLQAGTNFNLSQRSENAAAQLLPGCQIVFSVSTTPFSTSATTSTTFELTYLLQPEPHQSSVQSISLEFVLEWTRQGNDQV